ncbi:pentapeptide repeat-containing protein [Micromonospora cathayae]|uniref:Pentapeptide repeat-containing protein n=1 Tax=Micromonospora cathayae TaxID=3028804 RepID=A0ABY7ZI38_9ACTN|nr:pentapeptide repeat-containing protein [Micromonospora sp. HUAS 3]WDZ82441.1 pentapeptide repeat-containing protein [Micromonospora sp. HUAS 3]
MAVPETVAGTYRDVARQVAEATGATWESALRQAVELATSHPVLRQPTTDTICARLRARSGPDDRPGTRDDARTAVRALAALLRPAGTPAAEVTVDLSGAYLVDVDLSGCRLGEGRFADTRFAGTTSFAGTRFTGDALFSRALFDGPARFTGARFGAHAAFGRARFRGPTDFTGATFQGIAWFGRGEDELWEDDPAWDTIEEVRPVAWDEPNEDDPGWPVAVVMGDYQDWHEGGDGARFAGPVSFRRARFAGPAWFHKARFGADACFRDARFGGPTMLDQPTVDLAGARWSGTADDEPVCWPLGWTPTAGPDDSGAPLTPDGSVAPYAGQLADPDPDVRAAGLRILGELGDTRSDLRQRVVDAVCGYLRRPLPFRLAGPRTAGQEREVGLRRDAQRLLTDRLRPAPDGPPHWAGTTLPLSGATLLDLDLSGCRVGYADFTGTQFHGTTRFDDSTFEGTVFRLGGPDGRASFHGDVSVAGARLDRWRDNREILGDVVCHGTLRWGRSDGAASDAG